MDKEESIKESIFIRRINGKYCRSRIMKIKEVYTLDKTEQYLVETIATLRHQNKINTGWDGHKVVNKKSDLDLNICGFGGEFIFCRENNLFPDFTIGNTSKILKTDNYDAVWRNKTIDIKDKNITALIKVDGSLKRSESGIK